jgi:hypothetical protein
MSRALASGELGELTHHPMSVLIERPNALLSGREMRQATIGSYDIVGEAAWVVTRNSVGAPDGLYPVPGTWVLQFPSKEDPSYRIRMGGTDWQVPATDVVMMIDPNPANPYGRGVGLGVAMGDELDIDEYAAKTISAWFQNRAIPDAIISAKGAGPDAIRRIQENWAGLQQSFRNAHRVHFMSGEVDVHKLDSSFADQQIVELRKQQRDTVQQIFGIPPEQLGIMINSNRAASEAAEMHGARNVQLPRLEVLRIAYQRVADMFDDRLVVEYDDPIPADKEAQLRAMQAFPGRFTIDEERAMAGLPPLADGSGSGFFVASGATYIPGPRTLETKPQQVFGYHLAAGVLTNNEQRVSIGLPPTDEPWGSERTVGLYYGEGGPPGAPGAPASTSMSRTPLPVVLPAMVRAVDLSVPDGVREEAARALRWVEEFRRGGTSVGRTTARMLVDDRMTSQRVRRMAAYFPRHEVDKQGEGWSPGEDGYPSNGRIAWGLWGGDAGRSWADKIVRQLDREEEQRARPAMRRDLTAGDIQRALNAIDGADIGGIIVPAVEELMQVWGDETLGQLAESIDTQTSAASIDLETKAVREKLKELADERIARLINGVTKEELRALLQEAFDEGKPVEEIKADVTAFFYKAKAERSAVIAETEAVTHANFAGIEALEQSGVANIEKEWIATPDRRTRQEHRELDGQKQDLRTPFVIESGPFAGAKANHPGGFGIAEQDIMCRCTVGTVIDELRSAELVTRGIALPRESTAEQRAAYWRARDAKLQPLEAKLKAAMDDAFDAQLEAVLAAI